jgi:nicotinate-nucleotide adenylyltransferase
VSTINRIGVFGGGFDPPHVGHFICARSAAEQLGLSRVLVIPVGQHPLKPDSLKAPPELRLLMVQAIAADDPLFEPDALELDRGGVSYTVDTLLQLKERFPEPENELTLLIGMDSYLELKRWKEPDRLFELARVVVMNRGGIPVDATIQSRSSSMIATPTILSTPLIELSATDVRRRCSEGLPVRFLVGSRVEEVIRKHLLYQAPVD